MRSCSVLLLAAVSGWVAVVLAACGGDDSPPTTLLDGSRAVAPPVALEGVGRPAIIAGLAVVPRRRVAAGSAEAACLRGSDDGSGPLVVRVGAYATSLTFRTPSGLALAACDGVSHDGADGAWCGRSFGLLRAGRLGDPRLDLACARPDAIPIAFAWVEPSPRTRFVAVEQRGYVEVYAATGALPVRMVTSDVDVSRSSASFDVSEHDRAGRLVRRYRLDATVAD
jgi:hypothetical protein